MTSPVVNWPFTLYAIIQIDKNVQGFAIFEISCKTKSVADAVIYLTHCKGNLLLLHTSKLLPYHMYEIRHCQQKVSSDNYIVDKLRWATIHVAFFQILPEEIQMCKIFHTVGITLPHKIDFILGEKRELKEIREKCIKPKMYLNNINLI